MNLEIRLIISVSTSVSSSINNNRAESTGNYSPTRELGKAVDLCFHGKNKDRDVWNRCISRWLQIPERPQLRNSSWSPASFYGGGGVEAEICTSTEHLTVVSEVYAENVISLTPVGF